ncbi:hypothetical protein [Gordonia sihwensis]|uniref:hypothetical protein n=1 Tax=Gordonia sihwensis TaxID=173559 RepID=UPI001C92FDD5|nr:hypothetical protein [Gordonia sihwensis]
MAITSLPIDLTGFNKVQFFSATPAMEWDDEAGAVSDTQAVDEAGRGQYDVSLVVEFESFGRLNAEVIKVRTAELHGNDPAETCFGKEIVLENVRASHSARQFNGNAILNQRFYADSIAPADSASRKRPASSPTDAQAAK